MLSANKFAQLAAAAAGVAVLIAGCGGDDSSSTSDSVQLEVEIADGTITPNAEEVEVSVGTTIELTVTSDVAEELHVHGYDESLAVEPGESASTEFEADQTGRFEIETHEAGALVYQLTVTQ